MTVCEGGYDTNENGGPTYGGQSDKEPEPEPGTLAAGRAPNIKKPFDQAPENHWKYRFLAAVTSRGSENLKDSHYRTENQSTAQFQHTPADFARNGEALPEDDGVAPQHRDAGTRGGAPIQVPKAAGACQSGDAGRGQPQGSTGQSPDSTAVTLTRKGGRYDLFSGLL